MKIKQLGFDIANLQLLNPKYYLSIDLHTGKLSKIPKPAIEYPSLVKKDEEQIIRYLGSLVEKVVLESIRNIDRVAVLFSGGVDSTILCYILKKNNIDFHAYCVGREDSPDIEAAQKVAQELEYPFTSVIINHKITEQFLPEIERIIQTRAFKHTTNAVPVAVTIAVAIPYFFGMRAIANDNHKVVLTSVGTEELFAGFKHWNQWWSIQELCYHKTYTINQRDIYRDNKLASYFDLTIIMPFLNMRLAKYALSIPTEFKVKNNIKKYIWRKTANYIGVPEKFCARKNKATQYGSKTNRILEKTYRKNGFKYKEELIKSIYKIIEEIDDKNMEKPRVCMK